MLITRITFSGFLVGISLPAVSSIAADALTPWEVEAPNEVADADAMAEELINQVKNDYVLKDKRAFRDAHPRGIGCTTGTFTVEPNLSKTLRTGVFTNPGQTFEAIIRWSSALGPAGDQAKDARGMAIKLFGVPGQKLLDKYTDASTHDFLHIDAPTFPTRDAADFAGIVKIKSNPSYVITFLRTKPILHARELASLIQLGKNNPNNGKSMAGRSFFSQTPYLFKGSQINSPIKFSTRPCGNVVENGLDGSDNELRNDLQSRLQKGDLCFNFAVQFYKERVGFEVEDGMNEWKETVSPFISVAKIRIPKQDFVSDEKLRYCDNLSFQPWHALPEHRPLGNINRTRRIVYEKISDYRMKMNQEEARRPEPTDLKEWNSLSSKVYKEWNAVTIPAKR